MVISMANKNSTSRNAAQQLGSKGGKIGGVNRAKKLTSTQRSSIASAGGKAKAAKAKTKVPKHK
jgi:hypothetical protein